MKQLHTANIFNATLTPSTAKYKGYEYVDDVILDKGKANTEDFLKTLEQNKFKLGIPKTNKHSYYGLYIPIDQ